MCLEGIVETNVEEKLKMRSTNSQIKNVSLALDFGKSVLKYSHIRIYYRMQNNNCIPFSGPNYSLWEKSHCVLAICPTLRTY